MKFFCVTRPELSGINDLLEASCAERDVEYVPVFPTTVWLPLADSPRPGDLIYRAAVDVAASRMEMMLFGEGVGAFYETPFRECPDPAPLFVKAGLKVPRTVFNLVKDRDLLMRAVEAVGGFPVVLKVPGGEGGAGVIRVESREALFPLADYLPSSTILTEYFEHTLAYRLVVVGDEVVATEARVPGGGDFRTNSRGSAEVGAVAPPAEAVTLALQAAALTGVEFGGADVLSSASGELVVAEFNFPCYFPDTQRVTGVDIAGHMLDWLIAKAG
jgi:hypothetical protein